MGFSLKTASELTGLTEDRIRYWIQTGVLQPSMHYEPTSRTHGHLFSFQDLVALRTLRNLRDKHKFSLQNLRRIGSWLSEHYGQPWSTLRFYTAGDELAFTDAERRLLVSASKRGQIMIEEIVVNLDDVQSVLESKARGLRERSPEHVGKIEKQRGVFQNQPLIAGTRIPVATILHYADAGYTPSEIREAYPVLDEADIEAALGHRESARCSRIAS